MKAAVEGAAFVLACFYFWGSIFIFANSYAAVDTTFPTAPGLVDPIARVQIEHVKELLIAADKRYEQRFNAQESAVAAALIALEKSGAAQLAATQQAVNKQETASEKRLDSVNEFRGQLKDQAATFVTRTELWSAIIAAGGLFFGAMKFVTFRRSSDVKAKT